MLTKEQSAAKWQAYYWKNRDRLSAYKAEYNRAHPEKARARQVRYKATHPEMMEAFRIRALARTAELVAFIYQVKAGPCVDCGGKFPPECMDFDHVRGPKLFEIAAARSRRLESVRDEIAKCDLVCANCHRTRTVRQRRGRGIKAAY